MTLPSLTSSNPRSVLGARLLVQARQLDASLQNLEKGAKLRLVRSLRKSERELERELKSLYQSALSETANIESIEWREARAKVMLAQVRSSLNIAESSAGMKDLNELIHGSALASVKDALKGLSTHQVQTIAASTTLRLDVAARATEAFGRLKHHGASFATKAERLVTDGIIRGQGWGKTTRELRHELSITEVQAERIVRTESIRASHDARMDTFRSEGVDMALWVATVDTSVCGYCAARSGLAYRLDDIIIPAHPNCLIGDSVISAAGVRGYSKRWYEGPIVTITTRQGHRLTCTPNHPILTRGGWVGAGRLDVGSHVVSHLGGDGFGLIEPDDKYVEGRIEDVVDALGQSSEMSARPVPTSDVDFHGDGAGSEVAVIGADRHLWHRADATLLEQLMQLALVHASEFAALRHGAGSLDLGLYGHDAATGGGVCSLHLPLALALGHVGPLDLLGFTLGSHGHAALGEATAYDGSGHAVPLRQGVDAGTSEVSLDDLSYGQVMDSLSVAAGLDEVVSVERGSWSGHVYNLETEAGYYVAEGIVTHNCRCTAMPIQKEWIEDGMADEEWLIAHRKEAMEKAAEGGHKPQAGISSGEKYAGMTEAPEPAWIPGSGEPPKTGPVTPGGTPVPNVPTSSVDVDKLFSGTGAAPVPAPAAVSVPVPSAAPVAAPTPISVPAPTPAAVATPAATAAPAAAVPVAPPVPAPPAPVLPTPPAVAVRASPPGFLDEDVILGTRTGGPQGSNAGGFYTGTDGVKRYVKFYQDEGQAYGEHLANQIYRDLGMDTPNTALFRRADGTIGYASEIVEGKTLQALGLNESRARAVLKGYSADVLTANWDVVGMNLDNILFSDSGGLLRIDNGGSLLMRAKAGRKPVSALNSLTEFAGFADQYKNPAYYRVWQASGMSGPKDMAADLIVQIDDVLKLAARPGGWARYVEESIPGLNATDKNLIITMLSERTKQLESMKKMLQDEIKAQAAAAKAAKAAAKRASKVAGSGGFPSGPWNPLSMDDAVDRNSQTFDRSWWNSTRSITTTQRKSVRTYTGGAYRQLNDYKLGKLPGNTVLHSAGEQLSFIANNVDEVLAKHYSPVDATYYRTVAMKLKELPNISDPADVTGMVGRVIDNVGFASTSLSRNVSLGFGRPKSDEMTVLFEIKGRAGVTRGAYVAPISHYSGEVEFLMPSGTRFQVLSARVEDISWKWEKVLVLEVEAL